MDTNVLVAGLRSRRGASFQLVSLIDSGCFEAFVSVPLAVEYEAVLKEHAAALEMTFEDVERFVDYVCAVATRRAVFFLWRPTRRDPKDEMVLELAIAARCHAIVTFNGRDFVEAPQFAIEVLTPAEFLRKVRDPS